MADADYTYHVCSVEGCGSKSKALGFCSKHYMQSKRKGLDHYSRRIKCSHCGDEFEPAKASSMYCSKRCKQAAWKAANVVSMMQTDEQNKKQGQSRHVFHLTHAYRVVSALYLGARRCIAATHVSQSQFTLAK